jgi:crossover junction endodeoxyribonuclease RuvC
MLALGIDPGTAICGYGIVEMTGDKKKPLFYGSILTDKNLRPEERLLKIYRAVSDIIVQFHPDFMTIEKLYFNRNVNTAFPVAQVRGVLLLAAAKLNLPVLEFTPMQIKESVTGTGAAGKTQVMFMVRHLLSISEEIKPDDTADALAAAICGLNYARVLQLQAKGGARIADILEAQRNPLSKR